MIQVVFNISLFSLFFPIDFIQIEGSDLKFGSQKKTHVMSCSVISAARSEK